MSDSIYEMTDKELKKKLKELNYDYDRISTYGSPWGSNSTKSECAIINEQILSIENLLLKRKLKKYE